MERLLFGTAGIPLCTIGDTIDGIKKVKELNLDALELEFVRNINISEEKAPMVKKAAFENSIVLTCHAPYYINLNSPDRKKLEASQNRIINSAKRAFESGAWSLCFHAGYYSGISRQQTYENIKKAILKIIEELNASGTKIWIRPEISGKNTQFGDLDEIIKLSLEIEGVLPCIDFAHLHARTGKNNSYEEFSKILELLEKSIGKKIIENMHIHVSGIEYGVKGEKWHLNLQESDFNHRELLRALKDFDAKGVLISESPNIEGDAMLMKKIYTEL
jgi:deoxyribonuclease-4